MFYVTVEHLAKLTKISDPQTLAELARAINDTMDRFKINTTLRRVRYFVAQTLFETSNYTSYAENLYYSTPERLVAVWPSRFTMTPNQSKAYAPEYIRNPEKLANLVYANRLGNGSPDTGDGFRYRGSGGMHLTGKDNFRRCSISLYGDERLVENPSVVRDNIETAFLTAGWFWDTNKCNGYADRDEFTKLTGVINGSTSTAPVRLNTLRVVNATITEDTSRLRSPH